MLPRSARPGKCYLFHRLFHIHEVNRHAARSHRRTSEHHVRSSSSFVSICGVHSRTFTAGVVSDNTFAPSRFICVSKISRSGYEIQIGTPNQVTNRFRIVTVLSSPSSGPGIARLFSWSRDAIHANKIESVILVSTPCTNPHNSRSQQHTIAGDQVRITRSLSMITLCHFSPFVRCFSCPVQRLQEFSDRVFALHLLFRRQLDRRLTGRFCLTVCPASMQEQYLPSRRTTCLGFPHQRFEE